MNGSPVAFSSTGGYERYATSSTTTTLAQGTNTLTIALDTSAGGRGYLNLDAITLL